MELLIFIGFCFFAYGITKGKDATMQAKGQATPAPEWARAVFVLVVAELLFACLMTAPAAMLGR